VAAGPTPDDVLARIDERDVVRMALELGSIDSPAGAEGAAGEFVFDWLTAEGFSARKVGLSADRFNVVGRLEGSGDGCSLLFNSHLDTSVATGETLSTRHADDAVYHSAWRKGPLLYGNGVCNDKGQMAAWLIACKAVKDAGTPLAGDLVLTSVCGEIELEPIDEFQGPDYVSREGGTRYAIGHGAVADYALVAEATSFRVGWVEAGSAFFKVTVFGAEPPQYNPFVTLRGRQSPNAIVRLAEVVTRLEEWALGYEERNRLVCEGGTVVPRVNVGAIRGGLPYKITKTAQNASIYVDVRLTPAQSPLDVQAELLAFLRSIEPDAELELYGYRRGYQAEGVEPLVASLEQAHAAVHPGALERTSDPAITSMWRDLNLFAEAGIPCVMYGPGPTTGTGEMSILVDDLVQAARVYALLALGVTSMPRGERRESPEAVAR
jgi:acetylornithine deacetylase/succinyl-diaminopimelate desuccinylase-like protein